MYAEVEQQIFNEDMERARLNPEIAVEVSPSFNRVRDRLKEITNTNNSSNTNNNNNQPNELLLVKADHIVKAMDMIPPSVKKESVDATNAYKKKGSSSSENEEETIEPQLSINVCNYLIVVLDIFLIDLL